MRREFDAVELTTLVPPFVSLVLFGFFGTSSNKLIIDAAFTALVGSMLVCGVYRAWARAGSVTEVLIATFAGVFVGFLVIQIPAVVLEHPNMLSRRDQLNAARIGIIFYGWPSIIFYSWRWAFYLPTKSHSKKYSGTLETRRLLAWLGLLVIVIVNLLSLASVTGW